MRDFISEQDFFKLFSSNLYDKIVKESTIKFRRSLTKEEFREIKKSLFNEIITYSYHPSGIEENLFVYKVNDVARIKPVLSVKDELLYYFVCKMIDKEVAVNRTEFTYGGWRLSGEIRLEEDAEIDYVYRSYNPLLWRKEWQSFTKIVYQEASALTADDVVIKLDVANFYDSINLSVLEKKLLSATGKDKVEYINVLMHFLHNWNMKQEKYHLKTIGIPQSEFGDQSRLLSNFYLQSYDVKIKHFCDTIGAKYLRYADDQIIMCKNTDVNTVLYVVCYELNLLGLNLNASKVQQLNKDSIMAYYGVDIFNLLEAEKYDDAVDLLFSYIDLELQFKQPSVIKRIININLKYFSLKNRGRLKSLILDYDFLKQGNEYYFRGIYALLTDDEKRDFVALLLDISEDTVYNDFHYNLLNFFLKSKDNFKDEIIKVTDRIDELALIIK